MDLLIIILFLLALLTISVFFDITTKKIPNKLTFPVMLLGLAIYTYMDGLNGLLFSFFGILAGIAVFFIPFAFGGMGGGDVKLMGAIGALTGVTFTLLTALYTAIAGGILALVILLYKGRLGSLLGKAILLIIKPMVNAVALSIKSEKLERFAQKLSAMEMKKQDEKPIRFAYGIAIAVGVLLVLIDYQYEVFLVGNIITPR